MSKLPWRSRATAAASSWRACGGGKAIGVIDDKVARWVTGEKPSRPPMGKPMKASAWPSRPLSSSARGKVGSGGPSKLSSARSCTRSCRKKLTRRVSGAASDPALRLPGICKVNCCSAAVSSGTTWALVTTVRPSPTTKPVPRKVKRGLANSLYRPSATTAGLAWATTSGRPACAVAGQVDRASAAVAASHAPRASRTWPSRAPCQRTISLWRGCEFRCRCGKADDVSKRSFQSGTGCGL